MKVQIKVMVLLFIIILTFAFGVAYLQYFEAQKGHLIAEDAQAQIKLIFIFAFVAIFIFSFFFVRWIGHPLTVIFNSLRGHDSAIIKGLESDKTEFGRLATMISSSFVQKEMLVNEIEERQRIEQSLKNVNENLEHIVEERTKELKEAYNHLKKEYEERKKLQEQFLQAQKMETLGRLAGGVAHDFNNILVVIMNYAALVSNTLSTDDPRRDDVKEIIEASKRASNLTRQLLAFSRRQMISPQVLDLNELIANTEKMAKSLIGENVEFVTDLAQDLSLVKVDPGSIEQILVNLIVNGRDAISPPGTITVGTAESTPAEVEELKKRGFEADKYIKFYITDTGSGMSDEVKTHLFEPFFTTKPKGKGTGLGLATVYGIVKQHQGYIEAESKVDQGTTFKMYFPTVDEKKPQGDEKLKVAEVSLKGVERVLVIEDDDSVRGITVKILNNAGYKVFQAASAKEVFALIEKEAAGFDLFLVDLVLPDMDGSVLVEKLKHNDPKLKCLFVSGYTEDVLASKGVREKEGCELLLKPFSEQALLKKIRGVLR